MTDVLLVKLAEMEALRVDVAGVQVLADRTRGLAGELVIESAPTGLGMSAWSSATAVSTVHVAATATGDALAVRMQTTATKIAAANARFVDQEASSSNKLVAVDDW
jgi:hypothetical protein